MSERESVRKTVLVAFFLCLVCSILVSSAAIYLRPLQVKNRNLDMRKNILVAAGLMEEGVDIEELFSPIETIMVEMTSGQEVSFDPEYDQKKASRDPLLSVRIPRKLDVAGIGRRAKVGIVYLVREYDEISRIILPIHGKGLWSTMYGLIVLNKDTTTIEGITYYSQQETPGLGGEVENPAWQAKWKGKKVHDKTWEIILRVIKGAVNLENSHAIHQIDGLSGATITSHGVENSIHYWLGENAFGPFLARVRNGEFK
ncbi:MAG: Na(+)-translocating NADH-quinone reductase subunit C [Halobacteriovoraceae bacterium]|nr:Na(+)-translocating NADH-quinone reductase subunit C [Halobacteriovoraceae bacterium]